MRPLTAVLLFLSAMSANSQLIPFVNPFWNTSPPSGNGLLPLVVYWKCDEASGQLLDSSGDGHHLTEDGAMGSAAGILTTSRTFDFECAIENDDTWNEMNGTSWTFVGWVYLKNLGSAGSFQTLMSKSGTGAPEISYRVIYEHEGGGDKKFTAYVSPDGTAFTEASITPSPAIAIDTWFFVVARFNSSGNTMTLSYGTGASLTHGSPVAQGGTAFDTTEIFSLGAIKDTGITQNPLLDEARLDECALWKRVLSDAEVAIIFNGGTPLPFGSYTL